VERFRQSGSGEADGVGGVEVLTTVWSTAQVALKYALGDLPLVLPVEQVGFLSEPDSKPLLRAKIRRKGCLVLLMCTYLRDNSVLFVVYIRRE
jgi:hypothetical protein